MTELLIHESKLGSLPESSAGPSGAGRRGEDFTRYSSSSEEEGEAEPRGATLEAELSEESSEGEQFTMKVQIYT